MQVRADETFRVFLGNGTGAELAQAVAAIPAGVTSLNLSTYSLDNKTGAELVQVFAAIPVGVTSLNLSQNNLGSDRTGAELAQAFAAIPAGVTSLDLGENYLCNKTGAELAEAFATIPAGVTSLNLSFNNYYLFSSSRMLDAELAGVFAAIPAGVTSLNFRGNSLGEMTGAKLAQAFADLPAGVISLDLSYNVLVYKTGAELAQAFAAIPAGVTSLNLGLNRFGEMTGAELAEAFAAIPVGVTSLNLSQNNLGDDRTGAELAQAFATIPAGVSSLDLRRNDFGRKTGAELRKILGSLPRTTQIITDDPVMLEIIRSNKEKEFYYVSESLGSIDVASLVAEFSGATKDEISLFGDDFKKLNEFMDEYEKYNSQHNQSSHWAAAFFQQGTLEKELGADRVAWAQVEGHAKKFPASKIAEIAGKLSIKWTSDEMLARLTKENDPRSVVISKLLVEVEQVRQQYPQAAIFLSKVLTQTNQIISNPTNEQYQDYLKLRQEINQRPWGRMIGGLMLTVAALTVLGLCCATGLGAIPLVGWMSTHIIPTVLVSSVASVIGVGLFSSGMKESQKNKKMDVLANTIEEVALKSVVS